MKMEDIKFNSILTLVAIIWDLETLYGMYWKWTTKLWKNMGIPKKSFINILLVGHRENLRIWKNKIAGQCVPQNKLKL
jgi:hypothetical protein